MAKGDISVRVIYRNERLQPTYEKTYSIEQYTEMLKTDLMRLVTDVEDLCYEANDNKPKEEWSDYSWEAFSRIKHKLLDKAGDIGRLPDNIIVNNNSNDITNFVANVLMER